MRTRWSSRDDKALMAAICGELGMSWDDAVRLRAERASSRRRPMDKLHRQSGMYERLADIVRGKTATQCYDRFSAMGIAARKAVPKSESFGVRLNAETLARLDAYAKVADRRRGVAAAIAIDAGLDVLDGTDWLNAKPFPKIDAAPYCTRGTFSGMSSMAIAMWAIGFEVEP